VLEFQKQMVKDDRPSRHDDDGGMPQKAPNVDRNAHVSKVEKLKLSRLAGFLFL
jgi:hypothetical protein